MSRSRISVVINTCDEAHLLGDCIASVRSLADEIIVCDMHSRDGSADLARRLGCKVILHPRRAAPEPEARCAAIAAASGDWILALDPDMRLQPATCEKLRAIADSGAADMVDFYCRNRFFGRSSTHGHGSQPVFRKFFRKSAFQPRPGSIHSFLHGSLSGRAIRLGRRDAIEHLAYETTWQLTETLVRYARREAQDAWQQEIRPSVWRMTWLPLKRFLANYFVRWGWLDGIPGLSWNASIAAYAFLIEVYLWDLWRLHGNALAQAPAEAESAARHREATS